MIEVYKYLNGLSTDIMSDIFKLRENAYNLRNFHIFESQNKKVWLYVLVMSRTRFRVNPHSIVA